MVVSEALSVISAVIPVQTIAKSWLFYCPIILFPAQQAADSKDNLTKVEGTVTKIWKYYTLHG
jgi:hypothetical protein